jgi:hypothetical protein
MTVTDGQVQGAPSAPYDPMMTCLLVELQPVVEAATGLSLWPTYAYFRVYGRGAALKVHRDRAACEISVTLTLGCQPVPWPIWIEGAHGPVSVLLSAGDALVYRGVECRHWREPLSGDEVVQVFLHYVDQAGPYREWRFDKRPSLFAASRRP